VNPPSVCFATQGTCNNNLCAYSYADGAACDADGDKCTPNDSCKSGTCVADTDHLVRCIQRPCHTAPACNKTTGNCDDAAIPDGVGKCGGDGCTPKGDCTGGTCSTAAQTIDCSALDTQCAAGLCDPTKPGSGAEKCGAQNVVNGTACDLADKCLQSPACSGGTCVGTPKACDPSLACHVAMCNSTTGDCDEAVAPLGTACGTPSSCKQNATCDANGNCGGDPVPDGSPCQMLDCATTAACVSGACVCLMSASTDGLGNGDTDGGVSGDDAGDTTSMPTSPGGCSVGGTPRSEIFAMLFVALAFARRRRRI
jgi:MYXO-CTERM domain-containing protein